MARFLKRIGLLALFVVAILLIRHYIITPIIVQGKSMLPTLVNNERLLMSKNTDNIQRFDIVVFDAPNEDRNYIKRVIGLPGETVEIQKDQLVIDGKKYTEEYLDPKLSEEVLTTRETFTEDFVFEVPADSYFVLGDNRTNSTDSRYIGAISKKEIEGVARIVLWPLDRFGGIE